MAKNYIKGSFKEFKFKDGGSKIVASILVSDLAKLANEKGYATIVIAERKEADRYGNTHAAWENDFVPDASKKGEGKKGIEQSKSELKKPSFTEGANDDLPF